MVDIIKKTIERSIQLADQITKEADFASLFKQDCAHIKSKTQHLRDLLRLIAPTSNDLYERPTRRIMDNAKKVLHKTLQLVFKCQSNRFQRLFTTIPADATRNSSREIWYSICDVSWLIHISIPEEFITFPPIAALEPTLCLVWKVWKQIGILRSGTLDAQVDAAAWLVSLARDHDKYRKLIIEEGGLPPLLKVAKEGSIEGQENAIQAICLLHGDPVELVVNGGLCVVKKGHKEVQISFSEAESELVANYTDCQDRLFQNRTIRLSVSYLEFSIRDDLRM